MYHVFKSFPFVMRRELHFVLFYVSYAFSALYYFRFNDSVSAFGSTFAHPTCSPCLADPSTSTVDMDPR